MYLRKGRPFGSTSSTFERLVSILNNTNKPLTKLVRINSLEKQRWIKLQGVDTGAIYLGLTAVNFGMFETRK